MLKNSNEAEYSFSNGRLLSKLNFNKNNIIKVFISVIESEGGIIESASLVDGKVYAKNNSDIIYLSVEKINNNKSRLILLVRKELEVISNTNKELKYYKKLINKLN
ncbi:MAG: hypothetical protein SVN78_02355 [Deferribacterota bacterium]|nr:hypothetical protein [Deferribacterota bacterium]